MTNYSHPTRKSPRLQGYDYSQDGMYFITICAFRRWHVFGRVFADCMVLNRAGEIASEAWINLPRLFPQIEIDVYVVMPNHMHGIIRVNQDVNPRYPLGFYISQYKAAVTRRVHQERVFRDSHLWQRRFHDHIIRSEDAIHKIREYIIHNPAQWQADSLYSES